MKLSDHNYDKLMKRESTHFRKRLSKIYRLPYSTILKKPGNPDLLDTESLGEAVIQQWLLEFKQKANADAEYQSVGGYLSFKQTRQGLRLTGPCVGHQQHTNKGNDQTMEVSVWDGDLRATCFHNSCRSTLKIWEKRIKEELCIQSPVVVVKPENLVVSEHQSKTNLLSTWQHHQPWIIVVCMLLVTASVIISLMLLKHDVPIAPVTLAPKTSTLPQPTNKIGIKALPDNVRTEKPVRELVVKPAPAPEQISVPNKVETSAVTILDSVGNQSVEKVSIGTPSMHKTRKKAEIGTSNVHKTRKKVKTHSSQPADDWKVIEHQ